MKNRLAFLTSCLLFLVFSPSFGSTNKETLKIETIEQWQVIDLTFKAKLNSKNPFITEFGAYFTSPNGEKLNVPGFFNGNNEWVLRFSSSIIGKWTYETYSELKPLKGKRGNILVVKNENPDKHGSIITKQEDPQHFYYEDGTPYMQMAFECDWLFALDYFNKNDAPKTEHLLDVIKQNGFNQIVTTFYSFDVQWKKDDKLKAHPEHEYGGDLRMYPFLGTNDNPDFSQLNIEYFKNFDRVVSLMNERDIVAHLMIYVWNKKVNWPDAETEADNMYFDYIIKRYQAYSNIVWDVSKEALNNERCSEEYGVERIQRIKKLDAFNRLVSVHDYGFCVRNSEHVDFISTQTWSSTLYHNMLKMREDFPNHPIFNIEHGGYEISPYDVFAGDFTDPEVCLRRNYLCSFAGSYNTYYWQGASWNVIIHNPFQQSEDFIKPKFEYYKYLTEFFTKYPLSSFKPDPKNNYSAYCLKKDNETYLLYVPKENEKLSVYWKSSMTSDKGTVQWFNTLTGEYSEEEHYKTNLYTSPWKGEADAILIRKTK